MNDEQSLALIENARLQIQRTIDLRRQLANRAGFDFGQQRDYFRALGWTRNPEVDDYFALYDVNPVAERIVHAFPEACWTTDPVITVGVGDEAQRETPLSAALRQMDEELHLWSRLEDLDIVSGIGEFGVLLLGLQGDLASPAPKSAPKIGYLSVFDQHDVEVKTWEMNKNSPRYRHPLIYRITMESGNEDSIVEVHWSRVIHVAENARRNPTVGRSRLQTIFPILDDILYKTIGASSEAYWKLVFKGVIISTMDGYALPSNADSKSELEQKIQAFVHDMRRWLLLDGMQAEELGGESVDPGAMLDAQLRILSIQTQIPRRILEGSEQGQLASGQDAQAWALRVGRRRRKHVWPNIVRPAIMRLVELGALPEPGGTLGYEWAPLYEPNLRDQAEVAELFARALMHLTGGKGGTPLAIVGPSEFRRIFTPLAAKMDPDDQALAMEIVERLAAIPENTGEELAPTVAEVVDSEA